MTEPEQSKSLKSHLLIAAHELQDPNFVKTVVLLIDHNDEGSLGIVLNRPTNRSIAEIWKQIHEDATSCTAPVFWGGPVAGPLMVIHRIKALADIEIMPGVYFSTTKNNIDSVMQSDSPDIRFFIGCAGWSPGQLESEIDEGSWGVLPATNSHVFNSSPDLWKNIEKELTPGPIYENLGVHELPPDPSVN